MISSSIFDVKPQLRGDFMGHPKKKPITDDNELDTLDTAAIDTESDSEIDDVFEDPFAESDRLSEPQQPLRQNTAGLFTGDPVALAEETRLKAADEQRQADRQIGLLIGPKNLEKLRAFGYDVALVNADHRPLASGTAHKGLSG